MGETVKASELEGMTVIAGSPLGAPHRIQRFLKEMGGTAPHQARAVTSFLKSLENEVVCTVAERHKVTAAAVLLRWHLQQKHVCIPKTFELEHVEENATACFGFRITPRDIWDFQKLDKNLRTEFFYKQVGRNGGFAIPQCMTQKANDELSRILLKSRVNPPEDHQVKKDL